METLFSLWMSSDLLKARAEIKFLNENNNCTIPLPSSTHEAILCYQDQRVVQHVDNNISSKMSKLLNQKEIISAYKKDSKGDRRAVASYNISLKGIDSDIERLSKVAEFIKNNNSYKAIETLTLQEIIDAGRIYEALEIIDIKTNENFENDK